MGIQPDHMDVKTASDVFEYAVPAWRYERFKHTVLRVARAEARRKGFDADSDPEEIPRGSSIVLTWRWDGTLFAA